MGLWGREITGWGLDRDLTVRTTQPSTSPSVTDRDGHSQEVIESSDELFLPHGDLP